MLGLKLIYVSKRGYNWIGFHLFSAWVFGHALRNINAYDIDNKTIKTLMQRQHSRHCPDDNFKYIFTDKNEFRLKVQWCFIPNVQINNIPGLIQIMVWHWPRDMPLTGPINVSFRTFSLITFIVSVTSIHCIMHRFGNGQTGNYAISLCSHPATRRTQTGIFRACPFASRSFYFRVALIWYFNNAYIFHLACFQMSPF